jgi:Protein of unknown function (DUF3179)
MRLGPLLMLLSLARSGFAAQPGEFIAKPEAFRTLVNSECSHCRIEANRRASELRDDDRALCWIRGYSDGGAIPIRFFLNSYRVISDSYGVFVYDPDAGFARAFAPSYDFTFQGWRNGVMVMKHKDGTLYSCLTGLAFDGPKRGERPQPIPTLVSNWGYWLKRYPDAVAYNMFGKYQPMELSTAVNGDSQKSRVPSDKRLEAEREIFGVIDRGKPRAYPVDALASAGLINEKDDGESRVVLWYEPTHTAAAYRPIAAPPSDNDKATARTVTLEMHDKEAMAPFVDKETGSRWDIAGRAVEGELKGWTMKWLDGIQVKWFAWAAEYPETLIIQTNGKSP